MAVVVVVVVVVVVLVVMAIAMTVMVMIMMTTTTNGCFLKGLWKCLRESSVSRRLLLRDCAMLSSS